MYLQHFNLSEYPFTIAPNPHYLYLSEQHREALAHLTYGLNEKHGSFILLTGEVGTGKTTVCRCLLDQVPKDVHIALVLNPHLNECELLQTICDELGIDYPNHASTKHLIDDLNQWLLKIHAKGEHAVIIIEEAQNLSDHLLEQLRLLTNLETNEQKLVQIILIGQPELLDKLAQPQLLQLEQRIIARYHLGVLNHQEVRTYIHHRFEVAGGNTDVFPASVTLRIAQLSKGVPRLINLLCDRALLGCYVHHKKQITLSIVEQAAIEVFGHKQKLAQEKPRSAVSWVLAGFGAVIVAAFFYVAIYKPSLLLPDAKLETFASQQDDVVSIAAGSATQQHQSMPVDNGEQENQLSPAVTFSATPANDTLLEDGIWKETDAYNVLFNLWGVDFPSNTQFTPCDFARTKQLSCWYRHGTFTDIKRTNRPAVLKMVSRQGSVFFITLLEQNKRGQWLIAADTMRMTVSEMRLDKIWTEEFVVLWKRPNHYVRTIRPGDRGPLVAWLGTQLASIGIYNTPVKDMVYSSRLMSEVRQLQRRCGIQVDGLLGRETIILLNTINGGVPVLAQNKQSLCPKVKV